MRATSALDHGTGDLRRSLDRLDGLPTRPTSARQVLALFDGDDDSADPARLPASAEVDPAWALRRPRAAGDPPDALASLAGLRWWPSTPTSGPIPDALARLWRHAVAVSFAARRLAREGDDPDPDEVARAGLLHGLGLWALAAVDPDRLVAWLASPEPEARRELERRWVGGDLSALGRALAVRWACEPLVVDAAWLHADLGADLGVCSGQPSRLALIQRAFALAERTPWALGAGPPREAGPVDPRVRVLTAEVQSRCGGAFAEPDASPREERLTRDVAGLRLANARLRDEGASMERLVRVVAGSSPAEGPEAWADRAGLAWCEEPGVAAARVVWAGPGRASPAPAEARPASAVFALGDPGEPCAHVHLWRPDGEARRVAASPATLAAWDALAREVAERDRVRRLLDDVVAAHRGRVGREEPARRRAMLEALAEFAGGAGHELNNPLAVIVGRGQLLLAREPDPEAVRSLRAIIAQAQRAHRILRDLMYVARPPEPRPRPCQPEEIVRASVRDIQDEADARGVRVVVVEARDAGPRVWVDPDPLRQVADVLLRNALEATPSGGLVQFTSGGDARKIRWTVHDTGRGIGATEGAHLFDPFYCGRAAGRGLGLGLPRAARIAAQAGGELRWHSVPGQGTTFQLSLPVAEIPPAIPDEKPGPHRADRALPGR